MIYMQLAERVKIYTSIFQGGRKIYLLSIKLLSSLFTIMLKTFLIEVHLKNTWTLKEHSSLDTGCKLNVHKTFRRRPGRLLNFLCTIKLTPVPRGSLEVHSKGTQRTLEHSRQSGTRTLEALEHSGAQDTWALGRSRHFIQQTYKV